MAIDEKKLIEDIESFMYRYGFISEQQRKGMKRVIEIIKEQPKLSLENKTSDKWIPIKYDHQSGWLYNLPDDRQEVLVCWDNNGRITLDTFVDEGEDGCWWENGDPVEVGQAWMPLPEPYKGE